MKKRFAAIGLGAVLMLSLAACGDKKDGDNKKDTQVTTTTTEAVTEATTEATNEKVSEKETEGKTDEVTTEQKETETAENTEEKTEGKSEEGKEENTTASENAEGGTTEASENRSGRFVTDSTDRVAIEVQDCGADFFKVDIMWEDTADTSYEWYFEGNIDDEGCIEYENGTKLMVCIDEEGNYVTDDAGNMTPYALYTDGSGKFQLNEDGTAVWTDDEEGIADGLVFRR